MIEPLNVVFFKNIFIANVLLLLMRNDVLLRNKDRGS